MQAIARVNRVLDTEVDGYTTDKDNGYIVDYEDTEDLSDAFSSYDALAGFEEDLEGVMRSIGDELVDVHRGILLFSIYSIPWKVMLTKRLMKFS